MSEGIGERGRKGCKDSKDGKDRKDHRMRALRSWIPALDFGSRFSVEIQGVAGVFVCLQ